MLLGLGLVFAFISGVKAEDKAKTVTLKGTITCAKCDLKVADKCHTVIKVEKDGKDVVYYFDDKGSKKYHKQICTEAKKGTVKGTVTKEEGKNIVTVTKLDFDE
jgi:hypothetical protein